MKKIAVIQTAFPGDVILATPVFEALKDRYPDCVLAAVVRPESYPLVKNNPHVDDLIVYDKYARDRGLTGMLRISGLLKGYDWTVIIQRFLRSALIPFLAGIKKRTGYDSGSFSFLYNDKKPYDKSRHEVLRCLDLIDAGHEARYRPRIFIGDEEREEAEKLLMEIGIKNDFAVVAPGSVWPTKKYPHFPELIDMINERFNLEIILLGGSGDMKDSKNIFDRCRHKPLDLTGKTDLLISSAIISGARIVFANDSAPAHMAAAVETPVVAIFGPKSAVVDIGDLYCRPCTTHGSQKCPQKHFRCMLELSPERVMAEAESLIG
jgi:heptosyltransferase-2